MAKTKESKTFIFSGSKTLRQTPEVLQWEIDANKLITAKAEFDLLEATIKGLQAKLLSTPLAEEFLNPVLKKKIQFFLNPVRTTIDAEIVVKALSKADIAKTATFSVKALEEAGFSSLATKAGIVSSSSPFLKVLDLAKDDATRLQQAQDLETKNPDFLGPFQF